MHYSAKQNYLFLRNRIEVQNRDLTVGQFSYVVYGFAVIVEQYESLAEAKQRARNASERLPVKYAEEHGSVVLVGHGFFNRLIAIELKKMGWKGKRKATAKHWHCTSYSYDE